MDRLLLAVGWERGLEAWSRISMKSVAASIFSYLFMASSITAIISLFAILLILLRHFFGAASTSEREALYFFLLAFIVSLFLVPISLFLAEKFAKSYKDVDVE